MKNLRFCVLFSSLLELEKRNKLLRTVECVDFALDIKLTELLIGHLQYWQYHTSTTYHRDVQTITIHAASAALDGIGLEFRSFRSFV